MSTGRINRYIFREIAVPATLGMVIFTFVLIMGRMLKLVEMVINKGVPLADILRLFASLLPAFLVITLPLSFLLGVLLGFSRLSADGEVIALKSSGLSLYRLLKPVLFLALLATSITALLTLFAEPAGYSAFKDQVFQIASSRASVGIRPQVFNDEFEGLVLYAERMEEKSGVMRGVFIADERPGAVPSTIISARGRLIADADDHRLTLRLEDGSIHRRPREESAYQVVHFTTYDVNLRLGQEMNAARQRARKTKELSTAELLLDTEDRSTRNARTAELHQRLALPLAPLLFALVGVPLGIQTQRSGRGAGFAIGLALFLLYYLLQSFAETLALEGGLPPSLMLWLPNFFFFIGGMYLLRLAALERRSALLDLILSEIPHRLRRLVRRKHR